MIACPNCYQAEPDCDCCGEWQLAVVALGIDRPATLQDVAEAEVAEIQYRAAMLAGRIRRQYHALAQYQ